MRTNYNGVPIRLTFDHGTVASNVEYKIGRQLFRPMKGTKRMTWATLEVFSNVGVDKELPIIYSGFARCSNKDQFVKEVGRKIALKHLLQCMTDAAPHAYGKEFRRCVWNMYLNRGKKGVAADGETK